MHVEHRRDRHVDVVGAHQADAVQRADGGGQRQGVQHQLAVAEVDALGIAGGAGGVKGGGHRVLVEIREVVAGRGLRQQAFVFADQVRQFGAVLLAVGQQQGALHRGQLRGDTLVERHELGVDQHEAVLGVVHRVEDLLGGQANVDGVQHRADHRDGEHALEVAMAVPVHHRDGIACPDAGGGEYVGEARNALIEGRVAVAQFVAIDNFAGLLVAAAGQQQALDQQGIGVRVLRRRDDTGLQHGGTCSRALLLCGEL